MMGKQLNPISTHTLGEAQQRLKISRTTLWRVLRKYQIVVLEDVLDARVKRVRATDIERIEAEADNIRKGLAA